VTEAVKFKAHRKIHTHTRDVVAAASSIAADFIFARMRPSAAYIIAYVETMKLFLIVTTVFG
jgi:hypothetical protein